MTGARTGARLLSRSSANSAGSRMNGRSRRCACGIDASGYMPHGREACLTAALHAVRLVAVVTRELDREVAMRVRVLLGIVGMAVLACSTAAAAAEVLHVSFGPSQTLNANGRTVHASGLAGACTPDQRISITVTISQGGRSASGAWPTHSCTGHQQHWKLSATTSNGRLHKGRATGHAALRLNESTGGVYSATGTTNITLR
jgi:hypothetical protein